MIESYKLKNPEGVLSPALLFYPEKIQANIDQMIQIAGSTDRLRPHIKTYKCREIISMQLNSGISKFKCATLSETAMLIAMGVKDILVAYPLIGPNQTVFIEMVKNNPHIKLATLIDDHNQLNSWKEKTDLSLSFYIDINVGMNRTGISTQNAYDLYIDINRSNFEFCGLHVYDGHIHDKAIERRKNTVDKSFSQVSQLIDKIKSNDQIEVVCGGSISFPIHALYTDRNLSPGTTLLWDKGNSTRFPEPKFDFAALLLSRVISKPNKNQLCLDLGHKAVASEMKVAPVFFPQIEDAIIKVHSEEHLVIETEYSEEWIIGDVIYGIPWHICPTVALHEEAAIVRDNSVQEYWRIESRKRIYHQ